jgi:hypothetical protein
MKESNITYFLRFVNKLRRFFTSGASVVKKTTIFAIFDVVVELSSRPVKGGGTEGSVDIYVLLDSVFNAVRCAYRRDFLPKAA